MNVIERLMDNLRLRLPGAVDGIMKLELFNIVNEFCRETNVWRDVHTYAVPEGQDSLPLFVPNGAEIVRLISASHNKVPLRVRMDPHTKTIMLAPHSDIDLEIVLVLAPSFNTEYNDPPWVPEDMWARHYETFMDGVLYRMMSQNAKPYSNRAMANVHFYKYVGARTEARSEAERDYVQDGQSWTFPTFSRNR